jgi:hypothetical protein
MKTAWAALNSSASPDSEVVETVVFGLGSAGLLMDPETAVELARLKTWAEAREQRDEEILGVLGRVDIRDSAEAWGLGMSVLAHLDGPPVRSSRAERDEGLRALISRLAEERAETNAAVAAGDVERERLLKRVAELESDSATLAALEAAGVDNWEGYSNAFEAGEWS